MRRKFYVHIGPHKSGSSTIQHFLLSNKKRLEKVGMLYPKAGLIFEGQHNLVKDIRTDDATQPMFGGIKALQDELKDWEGDVIISSENFDSIMEPGPLEKLYNALSGEFDIIIIMVYRTQLPQIISYWNTEIRLSLTKKTLPEYIEKVLEEENYMRCKKFIASYVQVFGKENIKVIPFSKLKGKQYLIDRIVGLIQVPSDMDFNVVESKNISPSQLEVELLRRTAFKHRSLLSSKRVLEIANEFLKTKGISTEVNILSDGEIEKINDHYHKDNEFMESEFADQLDGLDKEVRDLPYLDFDKLFTDEFVQEYEAFVSVKTESMLKMKNVEYRYIMQIVNQIYKNKNFEAAQSLLKEHISDNNLEHYFFKNAIATKVNESYDDKEYRDILADMGNLIKMFYLLKQENVYRLQKDLANVGVEVRRSGNMGKSFKYFKRLLYVQLTKNITNRVTIIQTLLSTELHSKYLELGVSDGWCFLQINSPNKVGVDPKNQVSFPEKLLDDTMHYNLDISQFFKKEKIDILENKATVIYMHEVGVYQEALETLKSALKYIDDNGFIVISNCNHARKDIFKLVLWLRSTQSEFNCFVIGADHGIGIISREKNNNPLEMSLEEIQNFTFDKIKEKPNKWINLRKKPYFKKWFEEKHKVN